MQDKQEPLKDDVPSAGPQQLPALLEPLAAGVAVEATYFQ